MTDKTQICNYPHYIKIGQHANMPRAPSLGNGWSRRKKSGLVIKPNEKRPHTQHCTAGHNSRTMPEPGKTPSLKSSSEAGWEQNGPPRMTSSNEKRVIKMKIACAEKGCCNAATIYGLCTKHRALQLHVARDTRNTAAEPPKAQAAVIVSGYRAWKAAGSVGPRPSTRPNPNATETCKARHFYGCGGTPGKYDPETRNQIGRKSHSKACSAAWKAGGGSVSKHDPYKNKVCLIDGCTSRGNCRTIDKDDARGICTMHRDEEQKAFRINWWKCRGSI